MAKQNDTEQARKLFKKEGGLLRTSMAVGLGIQKKTLYAMRDAGDLLEVTRGWYRLSDLPPLSNPDLATIALRAPQGVVCLLSALSFHGLTTEIPSSVCLAIEEGSETPRFKFPRTRIFRFSGPSFSEGVEFHIINSIEIKIYSPEKTLADCFKFRNQIGLDTAIEALKIYRNKKTVHVDKVLHFAKVCRVEKIMKPYLESIL